MKTLLWALGFGLVLTAANLIGWWPLTLLAGISAALLFGVGRAVMTAFLAGVIGWELPLLIASFSGRITELAELLGQLVGLGGAGTVLFLLVPGLIGGLLALCSAWVTGTWKKALFPQTASRKSQDLTQAALEQ